jgi:hypothetical protein
MGRKTRIYYHKKRLLKIILILLKMHNVRCYFCKFPITARDFPKRKVDNVSIHHIDHDRGNNDISNLALAHRHCHKSHHMKLQKERSKK